jgi:hypothetical protein
MPKTSARGRLSSDSGTSGRVAAATTLASGVAEAGNILTFNELTSAKLEVLSSPKSRMRRTVDIVHTFSQKWAPKCKDEIKNI